MNKIRCAWAEGQFDAYKEYHDIEWGVPVYNDARHFEFLILEGAQAGLSWATVLKKREAYRKVFADFNPARVAEFTENTIQQILLNPGIIRNRLKVNSTVTNARKFLDVQEEFGSFNTYIWKFVDNKPIQNNWKSMEECPATSPVSDAISNDLKKRGFKFVGSTIIYAHMQACGLVNDHTTDCFRYEAIRALK